METTHTRSLCLEGGGPNLNFFKQDKRRSLLRPKLLNYWPNPTKDKLDMDSTGELYFYTELWQVIFCKALVIPTSVIFYLKRQFTACDEILGKKDRKRNKNKNQSL